MLVGEFVSEVMQGLEGFKLAGNKVEFIVYASSQPNLVEGKRVFRVNIGGSNQLKFTVERDEAMQQKHQT